MGQVAHNPYVGLFGIATPWRLRCIEILEREGIAYFDPTDAAWDHINHDNGDEKQALIDDLVRRQHEGILGATCILYCLAARDEATQQPIHAYAARCELGFLTGRNVPTYAYIAPDVEGRNYLWAQMKLYPHMHRCDTMEQALMDAVAYMTRTAVQGAGNDSK